MNEILGNLISPVPQVRCGDDEYPVLSMTMRGGIIMQNDRFNKRIASVDLSNYKIVRRGQLVVGFPINEGVIYPQKVVDAGIVSPAYNVWDIDQCKVNIDYLDYCLHSPASMHYYASKLRGSAARRRSMPKEHLLELPIYLPPLNVQHQIATTLNKAQSLIIARREQITVLDKLTNDLFIEMFGDLTSNSMNWDMRNFLDVAIIDTRMTSDFEKYADCYHVGIENIEKNTGNIVSPKKVKDSGLISGKYPFDTRHIIYSKIRPNLNKVALPDFEGVCSADSYPILVKNGVCERIYLATVMRSDYFLSYILGFSNRTNIPKVNKTQLSGFNMPVPPIDKQREYTVVIEKINCQKSRLTASLAELEILYQSLTERAFAGELFG